MAHSNDYLDVQSPDDSDTEKPCQNHLSESSKSLEEDQTKISQENDIQASAFTTNNDPVEIVQSTKCDANQSQD